MNDRYWNVGKETRAKIEAAKRLDPNAKPAKIARMTGIPVRKVYDYNRDLRRFSGEELVIKCESGNE